MSNKQIIVTETGDIRVITIALPERPSPPLPYGSAKRKFGQRRKGCAHEYAMASEEIYITTRSGERFVQDCTFRECVICGHRPSLKVTPGPRRPIGSSD